jgi:hypothetical protein
LFVIELGMCMWGCFHCHVASLAYSLFRHPPWFSPSHTYSSYYKTLPSLSGCVFFSRTFIETISLPKDICLKCWKPRLQTTFTAGEAAAGQDSISIMITKSLNNLIGHDSGMSDRWCGKDCCLINKKLRWYLGQKVLSINQSTSATAGSSTDWDSIR